MARFVVKRWKRWTRVLSLIFFFPCTTWAWSRHDLLTLSAFEPGSILQSYGQQVVRPEPLEEVLKQKEKVESLFKQYNAWFYSRKPRFIPKKYSYELRAPNDFAFLQLARLNPATTFQVESRTEILAREVLGAYADEPDWGMDQNLWKDPTYGYGKPPYGGGESLAADRAAFHTTFLREGFILRELAPEINLGMALERAVLFGLLSQLSFQTGHPYWGYRFCAWTAHYLQDLTQPYHAKAVPDDSLLWYLRFFFTNNRAEFKKKTTQALIQRHLFFERLMAGLLLVPRQGSFGKTALLPAIQNPYDIVNLAQHVVDESSKRAKGIDRIMQKILNHSGSDSVSVDRLAEISANLPTELKSELIEQTVPLYALSGEILERLLQLLNPEIGSLSKH